MYKFVKYKNKSAKINDLAGGKYPTSLISIVSRLGLGYCGDYNKYMTLNTFDADPNGVYLSIYKFIQNTPPFLKHILPNAYHSGIVIDNIEYYYNDLISEAEPGSFTLGGIIKHKLFIKLGIISQDEKEEILDKFCYIKRQNIFDGKYNLIFTNCNNFTYGVVKYIDTVAKIYDAKNYNRESNRDFLACYPTTLNRLANISSTILDTSFPSSFSNKFAEKYSNEIHILKKKLYDKIDNGTGDSIEHLDYLLQEINKSYDNQKPQSLIAIYVAIQYWLYFKLYIENGYEPFLTHIPDIIDINESANDTQLQRFKLEHIFEITYGENC
jgi:hypothetical protein